jgi:polyisoprenoid-binding protein YceI
MKHLHRLAVIAFASCVLTAKAETSVYQLDPSRTFIHFEVTHFGTSTLRGRMGPLSGSVQLDPHERKGYVGLVIATAEVDTGVPILDRRLCAKDLFDCSGHPEAYFVAERFQFDGPLLRELRGELTLRGVSQPLTLKAVRFGCHDHPDTGREVCGGDFEGELLRSDFGASFGIAFVSNRVRLKVQVEGVRE